jgi:hypothetical protein
MGYAWAVIDPQYFLTIRKGKGLGALFGDIIVAAIRYYY